MLLLTPRPQGCLTVSLGVSLIPLSVPFVTSPRAVCQSGAYYEHTFTSVELTDGLKAKIITAYFTTACSKRQQPRSHDASLSRLRRLFVPLSVMCRMKRTLQTAARRRLLTFFSPSRLLIMKSSFSGRESQKAAIYSPPVSGQDEPIGGMSHYSGSKNEKNPKAVDLCCGHLSPGSSSHLRPSCSPPGRRTAT